MTGVQTCALPISYRTGVTIAVYDDIVDTAAVFPLAEEVRKLLRKFLTRSLALAGQSVERFELPDEPELLSFTTACVLPIPNDEKQDLLENTDTAARLATERQLLAREVDRLNQVAATLANPPPLEPINSSRFDAYRCKN